MNELLRIFRKDVRHHWIEILGTLVLLTAYTWHTIYRWGDAEPITGVWNVLWKAVMVLVPVSWCLLVIRVIQDESLVGDRQFWITRPYDWKSLAVAKLVSAVVFIHIPLFIAQVIMLDRAGFPAIHYLEGLLWMQLMIFLSVVLTSAVVAVVTSSIVQVLFCIVGLVLYGFGMGGLSSLFPDSDMPTSTDASEYWSIAVLAGLALLVIVLQYGWRKTWVSRLVILGVGLMSALAIITPNSGTLAKSYPLPGAGEQPAVRLDLHARDVTDAKKIEIPTTGKKISIEFEMTGSDVAHATIGRLDGVMVTIQAPNGASWKSHWIGRYQEFYPGGVITSLPVEVDRKFFEQNRDTPVNVHFVLAVTGYRETDIRAVTAQPGEFPVTRIGTCWIGQPSYNGGRWLGCRAPLKQPSFVARVDSSASTCVPEPGDDPDLHESLYSWMLNDDSDPADFGITPVKFVEFYFTEQYSRRSELEKQESPLNVCNGTPFTLARPEIFQHTRVEAELDGVKLSDFLVPPDRFSFR
jgi:hypothetical protein